MGVIKMDKQVIVTYNHTHKGTGHPVRSFMHKLAIQWLNTLYPIRPRSLI